MIGLFRDKWLEERYRVLWDVFGFSSFSFDDALEVMERRFGENESLLGVLISRLWKEGWIRIKDEVESGEKIYSLIGFEEVLRRLSRVDPRVGRG